jgi:hypothetical protein
MLRRHDKMRWLTPARPCAARIRSFMCCFREFRAWNVQMRLFKPILLLVKRFRIHETLHKPSSGCSVKQATSACGRRWATDDCEEESVKNTALVGAKQKTHHCCLELVVITVQLY